MALHASKKRRFSSVRATTLHEIQNSIYQSIKLKEKQIQIILIQKCINLKTLSNLHDGVLVTVAPNVMTIIIPTIRWTEKAGTILLNFSARFSAFRRLTENFLRLGKHSAFSTKKLQCRTNLLSSHQSDCRKFLQPLLLSGDWDEKQIAMFCSLLFKHQLIRLPLFFAGKWFKRSTWRHRFLLLYSKNNNKYEDIYTQYNLLITKIFPHSMKSFNSFFSTLITSMYRISNCFPNTRIFQVHI